MSSLRAIRQPENVKTLATQYRLAITPKRSGSKTVDRSKNKETNFLDEEVAENTETSEKKRSIRRFRLSELLDANDFNFDDTDDDICSPKVYKDRSQLTYVCACKYLNVHVNKNFCKSLLSNKVVILNQRLTRNDVKACAVALLKNARVDTLTLDANNLGHYGVIQIAEILPHKAEILELNIINNAIGSIGAKELCRVLMNNVTVRKLDLSGNGFVDGDAEHFRDLMEENHGLRHLNLSHNDFGEKGGKLLAEGIASNDFLQILDLSWNHLRLGGAVAIGKSVEENQFLERLHLGWNGFHVRGCAALGESLKTNSCLTHLDLTCNRVNEVSLSQILKGLIENTTLRVLNLPLNPLYPAGALTLLKVLDKYDTIAITDVALGNQTVTEEFISLLSTLKEKRDLDVTYGHVLHKPISMSETQDDFDREGEKTVEDLISENPILVLMEYARQQNFRLIDVFKTMDVDQSGTLTKQEFKTGLQNVDIVLPDAALESLIDGLDKDKSGSVDFSELVSGHKLYKSMVKESVFAGSLERSQIGQIADKIRMVMKKSFIMRNF